MDTGIYAFITNRLTEIVDERMKLLKSSQSIPLVKSANVISVQSTTITIRYNGDSVDITGVPFLAGQSLSPSDNVMVFQNGSKKSSSWLAIKPAQ